jgi:hypothetical protein
VLLVAILGALAIARGGREKEQQMQPTRVTEITEQGKENTERSG